MLHHKPDTLLGRAQRLLYVLQKFELDICKALKYGSNSHTFDDIVRSALSGDIDVYELPNAVIIAELSTYPQHKVYHIFIAAGDLDEILDYQPRLHEEAKLRGASYLTLAGRKGWERVLKEHGWKHNLSIMNVRVNDGQNV